MSSWEIRKFHPLFTDTALRFLTPPANFLIPQISFTSLPPFCPLPFTWKVQPSITLCRKPHSIWAAYMLYSGGLSSFWMQSWAKLVYCMVPGMKNRKCEYCCNMRPLMEDAANVLSSWCFLKSQECKNWRQAENEEESSGKQTSPLSSTDYYLFFWLPLLFVSVTLHKTPPFNHLTYLTCAEPQTNCETAALYFHDSVLNPKWEKKNQFVDLAETRIRSYFNMC